jgi:photosystem II stability/assembly factor-like uncharacterized protein
MGSIEYSTTPVDPGEVVRFTFPSVKTYQLLSVSTSSPCWVRVYGGSYGSMADTRTEPGTPFPDSGTGFFAEVQTTSQNLSVFLSPEITVQVETTDTFVTLRNDSSVTLPLTITLSVVPLSYSIPPTPLPYNCNVAVNTQWQTDLQEAWKDCSSITHLPLLDLSSVTNVIAAWLNCSNLSYVPPGLFDNCSATDLNSSFLNCALTADSVSNILISLDNAGQENGVINLTGGLNSPPSLDGLSAIVSLEIKGWTVLVKPEATVPTFTDVSDYVYSLTSFGDGRVYAGSDYGYVYKSTDYGITFDSGTYVTSSILFNLTACQGDTIFTGSWNERYLYVSNSGGALWTYGRDFNDSEIDSIGYAGDGEVWVGTAGFMHKSVNNGGSWLLPYEPRPGYSDYYVSMCFPGPNKVIAGTYYNTYFVYSFDGGETWGYTDENVLDGVTDQTVWGLASDGDGTVLAGVEGDGRVFRSLDSGVTWDTGVQLGSSTSVNTIFYAETGVFYAGTDDNGKIYSSLDGGATWAEFFDPSSPGSAVLALTKGGNFTLIAGIDSYIYAIPYGPEVVPQPPSQLYPNQSNCVYSETSKVSGSSRINNVVSLTQAAYDAIPSPDPNTLYVIVG